MLAGNQLGSLPPSLAGAQWLALIRLAANRLAELPGWLTELPRLSWLALAGNPLGWHRPAPAPIDQVAWHKLQQGELLGEGASGHIYRVSAQTGGASQALKLFKGAVTSDGLPEHELAACLAAGQHPALCTPHAELTHHPQGQRGLLLPLIPGSHVNLAGPPSLDSCTRDIYAAGQCLPVPTLLRLAHDVAGAVAHLHQRGVMHGDLYAHNILWNPTNGDAVLSDFGAATLLPTNQPQLSLALQALEVRAFGCLLEEVVARAVQADEHTRVLAEVAAMAQACLNPQPLARPRMAELAQQLSALWHCPVSQRLGITQS
jgi:serine/threonine protein kinase